MWIVTPYTNLNISLQDEGTGYCLLVILLEIQMGRLVGILHAIFVFIVISIQLSIARAEAREFPDIHFANFCCFVYVPGADGQFRDDCAIFSGEERV